MIPRMNANERQLMEMIRRGEGVSTKFKTCRNSLSRDVYATVCAFLNRHGGTLLLGAQDSGEIQGVVPIDRADELGSGMRKLMLYGKTYGGADPEMIEGDIFRMVIPIPEFGANPVKAQKIKPFQPDKAQDEAHATPQATPQVQAVLRESEKVASAAQLQKAVWLKDRVHFLKNYLEPLLQAEWIERTIPDSPRSPKQKYRLTEKGRKVLKGIEVGSE